MDNIRTHELEILIIVSQNKNVPSYHFHHLFEHKWKLYQPRFNELVSAGLFEIVTPTTGMPFYNLTREGKSRITELLDQREREITIKLKHSKQRMPVTFTGWKTVIAWVNAVIHFSGSSVKIRISNLQTDNHRAKEEKPARFTPVRL